MNKSYVVYHVTGDRDREERVVARLRMPSIYCLLCCFLITHMAVWQIKLRCTSKDSLYKLSNERKRLQKKIFLKDLHAATFPFQIKL